MTPQDRRLADISPSNPRCSALATFITILFGLATACSTLWHRMSVLFTTHQHNAAAADNLDLEGIQRSLREGVFTSENLVDLYLSRISQVNDKVLAIACINPEAKSIAIQRDEERRNGQVLGALHGIPFLVKDTFVTLDQMDTTGGSYALVGAKYSIESSIMTKLREAGAIVLGKTNLSQWGMARSPNCNNGWSAVFGQALSGFHENQDPQGSSSGSAIAMSLKLASFTIGGETCGSIIYPAQRNGVVGLKPTVGLTSRTGIIPLNPEQDSAGPFTQYVKDSAIILGVIAGKDELDIATSNIPFDKIPDYKATCDKDGLKGVRVAIPQSVYKVVDSDPEVGIAFRNAVSLLRSLGAIIVDDIEFEFWKPSSGQREDIFGDVLLREAFEEFFSKLVVNPNKINNISDLIEFTKNKPEEAYAEYGADWFESARDAPLTSESEEFLAVKARMEHLGEDIVRLLDHHDCDVLLATPSTDLPLDLGRLPGISVPLGFYSSERAIVKNTRGYVTKGPNIPYAVTITGRRFSEEKLIACAYALEQATLAVEENGDRLVIRPHMEHDARDGDIEKSS